jgi:DNA-binding NtrC family response regulator
VTKVLLVDPDERALGALRQLLAASEPDWEIISAIGGPEAMALLGEHQFAVLIVDVDEPRLEGFALLRHAAQYHPETIRIVQSSRAATVGEPKRAPAHRVLGKPSAPAHLLTIARWAVRQSVMLVRGGGAALV